MTMESLQCPVCCENRFASKQALIDHLTELYQNLSCTICNKKCSSMPQLIDHLNFDNCQRLSTVFEEVEASSRDYSIDHYSQETKTDLIEIDTNMLSENQKVVTPMLGSNKMFVELFSDQTLKTQEPILVMQDGDNRYIIVDGANQNLNPANSFVTKQNNDGTISLSSKEIINDDNLDILEDGMENEEVYSCNTCGVSFTSVIDHIQNYHTDQEVVVETPMEEGINVNDLPAESITEDTNEKSVLRRMITETGDIIETPSVLKINMALQKTLLTSGIPKLEDSNSAKDLEGKSNLQKALMSSVFQKDAPTSSLLKDPLDSYQAKNLGNSPENLRHVQIDKFCVSTVKNINENNDQNGPFHKVVLKEINTKNDGKIRLYHCMSCSIYVKNLDDFKLYPCKKLKYSCPHCSVAYENSKSLCAHMKVHKMQSTIEDLKAIVNPKADTKTATKPVESVAKKGFTCVICGTVFASNKSLKLHKRMHDPVKNRPIATPVADGDYQEDEENLKFLCDVCNKWIPEDYRDIHLKSHDAGENINCDICNKKFVSNEYLEMHMNVHNLEKVKIVKQDASLPYSCVYCNRRFSRPHEKVKHERIHTGEKPHTCEICGKSFRVSYCLTLHMRTHTGARPYACLHCGKRFKAHSVYNHHLLTHSDVRAYKCPFCPKAFKTSVQLAGHKNCHTKPFSCQQCNRPFSSLYAVRVHTETHNRQNNLKFSCSLCGASYARAFALKDHVSQVHENALVITDLTDGKTSELIIP